MNNHRPNRGFKNRDNRPKSLFRAPLAAEPTASPEKILPVAPDLAKSISVKQMSIEDSYRAAMQEFCAEIDRVILRAKQRFMLQGLHEAANSRQK